MKPSVAIYCNRNTLGAFDEDSLREGVGGSETNAILFARELGNRGHHVKVYNDVERPKRFGMVAYVPKGNVTDKGAIAAADIWVVWRNPEAIKELRGKTGKKVLWLHDLVPENEVLRYSELYDLIWVQSVFHRDFYPSVADSKFMVRPSGIGHFEGKGKRDPNLHVYASNYDRGLDILLQVWPQYLFRFPDAKLVIAYGPQVLEALAKQADERESTEGKKVDIHTRQYGYLWENLSRRMRLKGVTHVGKLSKGGLADLYEKASVLAYPSTYPEVQCMTVTEAMDHGCVPVTSSLGALQETNTAGFTLPPDVPFTPNAYLDLLVGARYEVTEGIREAAREMAKSYYWEALVPGIMERILES